jgi:hypothetical protein
VIAEPDDLAMLEAEALADGFDGMTPPTLDELRDALPLAQATRANLRAAAQPSRRRELPEIRERLGAQYLGSMAAGAPDPLLREMLDPHGATFVQGGGGIGKGAWTTHKVAGLAADGHRIVIADYENHPDEWARRWHGLTGDDYPSSVLHVAPLTPSWGGRRGAIWKQSEDLRALALAFDASYLVVDSAIPACGGADVMKPETPALYFAALEYIGLPSLTLAHVNRADDLRFPFGSVFWHNLSRVTWSLSRDGTGIVLTNRKANNYTNLGRYLVTFTWRDDVLREVWERGYSLALADQIAEALGDDELTVAEVIERLSEDLDEDESPPKADSIRKALRRGVKAGAYTVDGQKYRRAE